MKVSVLCHAFRLLLIRRREGGLCKARPKTTKFVIPKIVLEFLSRVLKV